MAASHTNESVQHIIVEMKAYTLKHFAYEENMLKMKNYPRLVNHQVKHKNFVAKVDQLEAKLKSGAPLMAMEITKFLKDWLTNHILVEDKSYANYFKLNSM